MVYAITNQTNLTVVLVIHMGTRVVDIWLKYGEKTVKLRLELAS